ncbi:hypothetical protein LIER_05113 [Lithospermum erythrorhizon]|uniref:Uncharacterized protein n=1 Tax=Lithospermum erythrorhizon TaxID=34254 RepID=A0AAV3NZK9_LITER
MPFTDRLNSITLPSGVKERHTEVTKKTPGLGKNTERQGTTLPKEAILTATTSVRILKAEIDKQIKQGYLREFVGQEKGRPQGRGYSPPNDRNRDHENQVRDKATSPQGPQVELILSQAE